MKRVAHWGNGEPFALVLVGMLCSVKETSSVKSAATRVVFGNIEECFTRLIQEAVSEGKGKEGESPKANPGERIALLQAEKRGLLSVSPEEAAALGLQAGELVAWLDAEQAQALAVYRSRKVSIRDWIGVLRKYYETVSKKGDQSSRTSLEGVLLRLEQFEEAQMLRQYGPGEDTMLIEDLGLLGEKHDPWGVTVVEGGAEMDEFAKAALFSLLAAVVYGDAVVRRRESLAGVRFPPLQIFFEEANKVLSGVSSGAASDSEKKVGTCPPSGKACGGMRASMTSTCT